MNRVAILNRQTNCNVTSFVNCGRVTLVFVHHEALSFGAHQNAVTRKLDVLASNSRRIVTSRRDRGFVHQVRELGSGETRSSARNPLQIETVFEFQVTRMNFQNRFTTSHISKIHRDLTIESTRTRQRLVENVRTVSRSDNDNSAGLIESIHLDEQLVERLILIG